MPKITFLPMKITVDAPSGQSFLEIAEAHGIALPHACGGFCACSTCHVIVRAGDENLSPMAEDEEERLDRAPQITLHSRLGCQAKVQGDATVEIMNKEQ